MKATIISIIATLVLIIGVIVFSNGDGSSRTGIENNISVVDGQQIIEIDAKGGYSPRVTIAKAGMPTIIKVDTRGTFDCSSALTIPSLNYRKNLPPSGETIVDVPAQESGSTLEGLCAMGMYNFQVNFQ